MAIKNANPLLGSRLAQAREAAGLTQVALAQLVGMTQTAIGEIEAGRVKRPKKMREIAKAVKREEAWLLGETDLIRVPIDQVFSPDPEFSDDPAALDAARRAERQQLAPGELVERDARGGLGPGGGATAVTVDGRTVDGVRATWRVPVSFLHTELRARESDVDIIPVDGDSMIPTLLPGDRVLIHRGAQSPSPDGLFAIDDGIGTSVKRLQIVRGSDPMQVRIISDNPIHKEDVVLASDLRVLGRVICKVTRL